MTRPYLILAAVGAALALPASAHAADVTLQIDHRSPLRGVQVTPLKFPVKSMAVARGLGTVSLGGSLRFSAGKHKATFTSLRLSTGTTSSTFSGVLAKQRVSLFSARGKPALTSSSVALTGATLKLTPAAAAKLKRVLKLRRAPSTGTLGTLSLPGPAAAAPAPVTPVAPVPVATPTPSATPTPQAGCPDFAATPAGSVDWFGCDLAGSGNLKTWTDYIQSASPPGGDFCRSGGTVGTVGESGGAQRIAGSAYDHRLPIAGSERHLDGSITIRTGGTVSYTMPMHGIDEAIGSLRIELAADGRSGQVYAVGRSQLRTSLPCTAATAYAEEHVLDLDLSAVTPVTEGLVTRYVHVPATIAASTDKVGGDNYGAGAKWGSFTLAVPTV